MRLFRGRKNTIRYESYNSELHVTPTCSEVVKPSPPRALSYWHKLIVGNDNDGFHELTTSSLAALMESTWFIPNHTRRLRSALRASRKRACSSGMYVLRTCGKVLPDPCRCTTSLTFGAM
jgi:hypothetical protein